jgi:hypothetical protein
MNALHGWSHIRPCQCENHPLYLNDAGLSDMEDCERSFSLSNQVALLTRHATKFHRLQALDMHFQHTDWQRYQSLGKFQFDNYRQALRILADNRPLLEEACQKKGFIGTDYHRWLQEEKEYLLSLERQPKYDETVFEYLRVLDKWRASMYVDSKLFRRLISLL